MLKQISSPIVYLILRLVGIECNLEEVKKGKYFPVENDTNGVGSLKKKYIKGSKIDGEIILKELKDRYSDLENRRNQLTNKGQAMLTIGGLMVPLFVYVISLTSSLLFQILSIILLFILLLLLIHLNRITTFAIPIVDKDNLKSTNKDDFYRELSWDYYRCFEHNNYVLDYLIDVLKGSYRVLMLTVIVVSISYVVMLNSTVTKNSEDRANYIISNSCDCSDEANPQIKTPNQHRTPNENEHLLNPTIQPDSTDSSKLK